MDECCSNKEHELRLLPQKQKKVLKIVLLINLLMFLVEGVYGFLSRSTALMADSLDMLGDAFVYAVSLYVIGKSVHWSASVSLVKGLVMALFGLGVLADAVHKFLTPVLPDAPIMGAIGALALVANLICALLLLRHRHDDINMRSTWLCSRNDVVANLGVLIAAFGVAMTQSKYPDLIFGVAIAGLVLRSAYSVLVESWKSLKGYGVAS